MLLIAWAMTRTPSVHDEPLLTSGVNTLRGLALLDPDMLVDLTGCPEAVALIKATRAQKGDRLTTLIYASLQRNKLLSSWGLTLLQGGTVHAVANWYTKAGTLTQRAREVRTYIQFFNETLDEYETIIPSAWLNYMLQRPI